MGQKIIIGITQGDSNGVGYEVIIKSMIDARMTELCVPILYGSSRIIGQYKKTTPDSEQLNTNVINSASDARGKRLNIINCVPDNLAIEPGQPHVDGAKGAILSLNSAIKDLKEGLIDAVVTAPINKHTMQQAGFAYTGHTEFFTKEFGAEESLMFLCAEDLKVGICTNHISLADVSSTLSQELILKKLRLMNQSLKQDFAIVKPKIAVLGLNPHASDNGSLGNEESQIIIPAIEAAAEEDILAFGPYSPDGFFGANMQRKFDAVLAMYHDQGLIPFKTLAFDKGVNFTAGLPIVRTSPDHGTGYDIVGKGVANQSSMMSAIYMAIDICNNRRRHEEMNSNPL